MTVSSIEDLLDALPIGALCLDAEGRILAANGVARRSGLLPAAPIGESAFDLPSLPEAGRSRRAFALGAHDGALHLDVTGARARMRVTGLPGSGPAKAVAILEPAEAAGDPAAIRREVDRVVGDLRHDVNNPLMGVMGQLELLQLRRDLAPEVREKIESALAEAERIRDLLRATKRP